ncbi:MULTISPECIES: chemotaxis protein CheW [unclassified Sphingomonas]|uniref:chemotaxis protein CheW n=1 Tax=unclassified Sphingomonas TaxID=196159 RepID=UPI0006F280CD|nr:MULTISPECIES: chemotaxis protein CheW [unclassified Sphingomonas]KQM56970.1 chemotaxis protein CheW [Sphingomonas sp. Leaf16]KQN09342.1 chemotaxis protein CheW [Sphingomonas sp. Leaf29]KQN17520.1 chemotaxis protein CheW [Sphingomonas sp. Leaf32]
MTELFLLARVAGQDVAILSDRVESVVDIAAVSPVPRTSRAVRGLAALRSRVVTVIDTALAIDPANESSSPRRAVVTQVDGHHYALLVDMLDDAYRCEVRPLSSGLMPGGAWAAVVGGMIDHDGRAVLVLNLTAVVARAAGNERAAA